MPMKSILVVLNDLAHLPSLLDATVIVARQNQAHVIGLYVLPAIEVYADAGMVATPLAFEGYRNGFIAQQGAVQAAFNDRMKKEDLSAEWRLVDSPFPNIADAAILHARSADLVVSAKIAEGIAASIENDLNLRLVMEAGRPVLIIPDRGNFTAEGDVFGTKALVGVNASRESARALFDAVPLLKHFKETEVLMVDPPRRATQPLGVPCAEEAATLARHGIAAVANTLTTEHWNAGQALLTRAMDTGATLLVIGAYGHSRLREYVFGGATRYVLSNMNIPVLLSH